MAAMQQICTCPKCGYIGESLVDDPCPFCKTPLIETGQSVDVWNATARAVRQRKYKDIWVDIVFPNPQFSKESWDARLAAGTERDRETASIVTPPVNGANEPVETGKKGFFSRIGKAKG